MQGGNQKSTTETTMGGPEPDAALPQRRAAICNHMLSMIYNANETLEEALNPKTKQVPKELFEKCHGIVLLALVKGGICVTLHAATGIMMAKNKKTGEWSPPVAVYQGGYAIGPVLGYKDENVLLFIMDEETMNDFANVPQTRLGVTAALTVCKSGVEAEKGIDLSKKRTITVAFSHYAFAGFSLEMSTLETAINSKNEKFYGKKAKISQILFEENAVSIPEDSLVPDIQKKLHLLAKGETWVPGDLDRSKTERHIELAEAAEKEVKQEMKQKKKGIKK